MISVEGASMIFTLARPFNELFTRPLAKKKTFTALSRVDLEIHRGDRVAILGPNGAGKTTLLKLIGGLLLPTEGEIFVNGFSTTRRNMAARRSVGFMMNEERSFFWRLTGRENLEFFGALDNLHGRALAERIDELIELVGMAEHVRKPFSSYSSGMKQRLSIARGLINDPEVIILDEPTRTLDPVACEEVIDLILNRLHSGAKKTLLIATHRFEEAYRLCDKVLMIDRGRVVSFDRLFDLKRRRVPLKDYYMRGLAMHGGAHAR